MPFNKLNLNLTHCFGIKKLAEELDADSNGTFAIYAPNGTMKTSLSRTFKELSAGRVPSDEMYPDRETTCQITDEEGAALEAEQIVVIPPYEESFERTSRVSTLLVNSELRDRYQELGKELDSKQHDFLSAMRVACGRRDGVDNEISLAFMGKPDAFLDAVRRVQPEVAETDEAPFADVPYKDVFNEKVKEFLAKDDVRELLVDYVDRLNSLLDESQFFSRETFSYYGAEQVASALDKHGFFEARHTVALHTGSEGNGSGHTIASKKELAALIQAEKKRIAEDEELRKNFGKIGKQLEANVALRNFKQCLDNHPEIIPLLPSYDALRQEVWKSYFVSRRDVFIPLVLTYERARVERRRIQEKAKQEITHWEEVISVFNQRFSVPFRLKAKNHVDLVLGRVDAMELAFEFKEANAEAVIVDETQLLKTLSQGERRARYLLDVLFEVEARRREDIPTLFVFDDVADSFDYKNKYAILRYLEEIKDWPDSRMIILTHNFDFLRAVHRHVVARNRCYIAVKGRDSIHLHPVDGLNNIFVNDWKRQFFDDPLKRIASIPFMRNLVEYVHGKDDIRYATLTSLLHWKHDTPTITNEQLDDIFNGLFGSEGIWRNSDHTVWDVLITEADSCLHADEGMNFPNKVVLAMASRLLADKFMLGVLRDEPAAQDITANQTSRLFRLFCDKFGLTGSSYDALHRTLLITPEHIHLNAFMYEPIIDVSDTELRTLYGDLKNL